MMCNDFGFISLPALLAKPLNIEALFLQRVLLLIMNANRNYFFIFVQVISKLHYSNDHVLSAILIPGSLFILSILLVLVSFSPCHVTNPFRIKFTKEALNSAKIFTLKIIEILENSLNSYLNKENEENSNEIEM